MAQQVIGVGSAVNDGTGDPGRTAFVKVNANFTELYASPSAGGYLAATITAASTDNYNPGGAFPTAIGRLDINPSTLESTLTGLLAGADGQRITFRNIGTVYSLILSTTSTSSSAANRFSGTSDAEIVPGASRDVIYYSLPSPRWSVG